MKTDVQILIKIGEVFLGVVEKEHWENHTTVAPFVAEFKRLKAKYKTTQNNKQTEDENENNS